MKNRRIRDAVTGDDCVRNGYRHSVLEPATSVMMGRFAERRQTVVKPRQGAAPIEGGHQQTTIRRLSKMQRKTSEDTGYHAGADPQPPPGQ